MEATRGAPAAEGAWPAEVMPINPFYERFVHGRTRRVPIGGVIVLLPIGLALLGVALFLVAQQAGDAIRWSTFQHDGVRVDGRVIAFTSETYSSGWSGTYTAHYVEYQYTALTAGGRAQTYRGRYLWPPDPAPAVGSVFPVLYLPAQPEESLYGGAPAPDLGDIALTALAAGGAGVPGAVLVLVSGLPAWLRLRRLQRNGRRLVGTVAAIGPPRMARYQTIVPIAVEFRSPVTHQHLRRQGRYAFKSMLDVPPPGQSVPVLYRSDRDFAVL